MSYLATHNTSIQLFQCSLRVVRENPRLVVFPLTSLVVTLTAAFFFFGCLVVPPSGHPLTSLEHWQSLWSGWRASAGHPASSFRLMFYAYTYGFYAVSTIVSTFLNAAFYNEIIRAMAGEPVSLVGGLRFACGRIRAILAWSLFAVLVGAMIRLLADRLGWLGKWVLGLFGVAWSAAAVFVIPVMIREASSNPIELMRKSAATLKKTWGEAVLGFAGISLGTASIVTFAVIMNTIFMTAGKQLHNTSFMASLVVGEFLLVVGFVSVMNVANSVYRCALYVYATEGVVPEHYTPELMDAGWKIKTTTPKR